MYVQAAEAVFLAMWRHFSTVWVGGKLRSLLTKICGSLRVYVYTALRDANVMGLGGSGDRSRPPGTRARGVLEEVGGAPSALHPRRPRLAR